MRRFRRRHLVACIAATTVWSACGGSSDTASEPAPSGEVVETPAASNVPADAEAPIGPVALLPSQVDLVGDAVVAEAEIESNLLPSVVLDDLSTGRKVNFRNLIPQQLPVLLWMWAPN